MKFVGILFYLSFILEIIFAIKLKKNNESPLAIFRRIRLERSKNDLIIAELRVQKNSKKSLDLQKKLDASTDVLKNLRLKFKARKNNKKK